MPVRMALLKFLFTSAKANRFPAKGAGGGLQSPERLGPQCANVNCITVTEPGSTRGRFDILFSGAGGALILRCIYCDHRFRVQLVGHVKSKRYCSYDPGLADTIKEWLRKRAGDLQFHQRGGGIGVRTL